jgi:hypothetical protein
MDLYQNGMRAGHYIGFEGARNHYNLRLGNTTILYGHPTSGKSQFMYQLLISMVVNYEMRPIIYSPETGTAAEIYCDIISINYYGNWELSSKHSQQWASLKKPFIITEFYTKAVDSKMDNITGAGWLVKTQDERGIHYQNFCLSLLQNPNCVGWHWFRYQDNDPNDPSADPSNKDANKGIVNTFYEVYNPLLSRMKSLNENVYQLIKYIDKK